MRLRRTLDMIKRRRRSIIGCGIVVGIAAAAFPLIRTPTATAVARVRLVPAGGESLGVNSPGFGTANGTANALIDARSNAAVARRTAGRVPGVSPSTVRRSVSVHRPGAGDIVEITATNSDAGRAAAIANAFARSAIDARRSDLVDSLRSTARDLQPQLTLLETRMTELDAQARSKGGSPVASAELAAVAAQHQAIQSRQQDLRRAVHQLGPDAMLVAPATASSTSTDRHPLRDGLLGGLCGLILGVIVALIREAFDERVRSTEAIEGATGLPILAELPRDPRSKQQPTRVAVFASPKSALSEATRALRAGIELRDAGQHPMSLLVTSAASGEGKSLVSANLAAAYAVAGFRTVLVDGDLRTPRQSSMFGTYPEPLIASGEAVHGLSSLLRAVTWSDADRSMLQQAALLRTPIENLLVLPAGPEPANPAELLDSPAMANLLADLAGITDIVIIDAPPLLPVSDAVGLARHADAVVLVAAMGESDRRALRRIRQMLAAHPRVLGVVANKVAPSAAYATYVARRRGTAPSAHPATRSSLRVVRPIEVPTPPTGFPDENGDMWIDLSDDTDPYGQGVGALQLNSWGR